MANLTSVDINHINDFNLIYSSLFMKMKCYQLLTIIISILQLNDGMKMKQPINNINELTDYSKSISNRVTTRALNKHINIFISLTQTQGISKNCGQTVDKPCG